MRTPSFGHLATLVAVSAVLSGGCTASSPPARPPGTTSLSDDLVRLRASLEADPAPPTVRERSATGRPSDSNVIGDAGRPARPARPFPRPLDPVPPLYRPPDRRLALQPLLDAPHPSPGTGVTSRDRAVRRDPLGAADPLRRIDPLTGRDPLGRPDPTGGVDIVPTRSPAGPGAGLDGRR